MNDRATKILRWAARNEITEHEIYRRVAARVADPHNRSVLEKIAEQEKHHYELFRRELGADVSPSRWRIWTYVWLVRILGLTFGLKLMEQGERLSERVYGDMASWDAAAAAALRDEQAHEAALLALINEKRIAYAGSFVLGLNDALVELTGALAGFTLALPSTRLIAAVGLITGIAATLSMAASEYLSAKEEGGKHPAYAALTTGAAYLVTVLLLIAPYFAFASAFAALGATLAIAVVIIVAFTFYTSVAKDMPFKGRFATMAAISLGVAALNFGIGFAVKTILGIDA